MGQFAAPFGPDLQTVSTVSASALSVSAPPVAEPAGSAAVRPRTPCGRATAAPAE